MDCQIAYRSQQNEQEMMLEATLQAIDDKMSSQEDYSILSIGCGSGLFEKPFLEKLLSLNKTIHFVGIDPNEAECVKAQEWCDKIRIYHTDKFNFKINTVGFESFQSRQGFDIILLIHSLYYFSDIKTLFRKIYELSREGGMVILGVAKRQLLNEPFYHATQRLYGKYPWFSDDVKQLLTESNLPFRQEKIDFTTNITKCFDKESELGKQLLNFIVGANTEFFSPLQLRLLLDYFGTSSQKMEGGEIMLPHSVILFYIEKQRVSA
ncbi:class I SAM-dependent methyltransferase [Moorena sp. SIO3I6]|uniref:class I SAM-dependent methyltransferase n=1 Tax=Moorena sp. SIO3I6 TaxID=2607831 RepID=UPI0013FA7DAC|nr:class I SAM-dependent methyltransferase [Moorena sp. SIO3I6]NEP22147.1 class I SAM-dependent methyltransferase [Moorena sp. SIO3I6]